MKTLADRLGLKDQLTIGVCNQTAVDFPQQFAGLDLRQCPEWRSTDIVLVPAETEGEVDEVFSDEADLGTLASVRSVWICYRKGNAAEINRDKLWVVMSRYGWKAVAQVSLDDVWLALRVRPLKSSEAS